MRRFQLPPGRYILDRRLGGRVNSDAVLTADTDDRAVLLLGHGFVELPPEPEAPVSEVPPPPPPPVVESKPEEVKPPAKPLSKTAKKKAAAKAAKVKKAAPVANTPDDGEGAGAVDGDHEPDTDGDDDTDDDDGDDTPDDLET
jgi:outer membrane biosynthesis protein TonB